MIVWNCGANKATYVQWRDGRMWPGYFEEFPDYMTQGKTPQDLECHLSTSTAIWWGGEIPGIGHSRAEELATTPLTISRPVKNTP